MPLSSRSAVDSEYPADSCCLLQDVAERSRQKSGMLQGYGDAVLRAEALEEQLVKAWKLRHAPIKAGRRLRPISQRSPRYAGEERRGCVEEQVAPQQE
jgi:hypothetical protein